MKVDRNMPGDFAKFKDFARKVVSVPHAEIKAQLDAEKAAKKSAKTSSRVSGVRAKRT